MTRTPFTYMLVPSNTSRNSTII